MSYATLRGHSDRPLTQHMHQSPTESPCRDCKWKHTDKTDCAEYCKKLAEFQGRSRPINLDIKHDPPKKPRRKKPSEPSRYIRKPPEEHLPSGRKRVIPEDATCSYPGCDNLAEAAKYKDLYTGYLCHRHYALLSNRWTRNMTIYDKEGNL